MMGTDSFMNGDSSVNSLIECARLSAKELYGGNLIISELQWIELTGHLQDCIIALQNLNIELNSSQRWKIMAEELMAIQKGVNKAAEIVGKEFYELNFLEDQP